MSDSTVCPACGTKYQTIYYQRRAADEPPDKVTFCSDCPLDTSKLSISHPKLQDKDRNTGRERPAVHRRNSSSIDGYTKQSSMLFGTRMLKRRGYRLCLRVEGAAASRCYRQVVQSQNSIKPVIVDTMPIQIEQTKRLIQVRKSSVLIGESHIVEEATRIAPLVSMERVAVYVQKPGTTLHSTTLVIGYEVLIESIDGAEFTILRTLQDGKQPSILVILPLRSTADKSMQNSCLGMLQQILATYGTEKTIKSFVSSQTISLLFIQSGKAYDWPSAPSSGYAYTWKPDGERFWYVKYGCVWLFSRRLLSGRITGWTIAKSLDKAQQVGPVLDVEVIVGHQPILIDILITSDGRPTSPSRSLEYVLDQVRHDKTIDIPLFIRDYYKSEQKLLDTKSTLKYPIDGVVGIQDGSMTIIKLKDSKSIELRLKDNGDLVSAEDTVVARSKLQMTYPAESIIELRFTKESSRDKPIVTETLLRTDKTKANSYDVCRSIINTISVMPDALARRNVVQWCASIRQKINQIASKATGRGRVILDIGAGDGQAISDYSTDNGITYVLIEPDRIKCQKLMKRLAEPGKGQSRLFEEAHQITKAIGLTSNNTLKYAVVCATIGDVLRQPYCIRTLKGAVRYCVASFSISHTVSELKDIALNGIDVIGCGYMYDDVGTSGVLISESGVKMELLHDKVASVKWGSDRTYTEQAIQLKDFKEVFHIRSAKSLVPVFSGEEFPLLNSVSSKVYIISTKRHI